MLVTPCCKDDYDFFRVGAVRKTRFLDGHLIENRLGAGDYEGAERYAELLVVLTPIPTIIEALQSLPANHRYPPVSISKVQHFMHKDLDGYRGSIAFNSISRYRGGDEN